jgi:hypothetical protein
MPNAKSKRVRTTRGRGRPPKLAAAQRAADGGGNAPADPLAGKLCIRPNDAWPILGIGPSLGWELIKDGRLKTTKIGKARLIFVSSIQDLLLGSS